MTPLSNALPLQGYFIYLQLLSLQPRYENTADSMFMSYSN
ncbi:hypothetical protein FDUTEX481_00010 [Tolypothrix sp. PCC 7601]|nr:hypothetical protein FDUTEX481_00010 [Tolypothrix sp. PCC 7601]